MQQALVTMYAVQVARGLDIRLAACTCACLPFACADVYSLKLAQPAEFSLRYCRDEKGYIV